MSSFSDIPLVSCEITFEASARSFSDAIAYVRLEDVSRVDTASRVVIEQVIHDVSHQTDSKNKLEIEFHGQIPNNKARYVVSVHIDVDKDGQISQGDYINMESHPVLTFGHPNQVSVRVREVK